MPKLITNRKQINKKANKRMRVNLRILRNGHVVENVYIGEKLTAFVTAKNCKFF